MCPPSLSYRALANIGGGGGKSGKTKGQIRDFLRKKCFLREPRFSWTRFS